MSNPKLRVNDVDERPSEFEEHTLDLVRAQREALQRGAVDEAERIRGELEKHGQKLDALRGEW